MAKSQDDRVIVHNIDIDCNDHTVEYIKKIEYNKWNEFTDQVQPGAEEKDVPFEFNHADGFSVMYGGNIFNIRPGETRALPRYIGEHYAKHLIDHMLQKKGELLNNPNIVNDIRERTEMLSKIIISEELLYGDYTPVQIDNMDKTDAGSKTLKEETIEVPDSLRGFEVVDQSTVTLEDIKNAPHEEIKDGDKIRTRAELMTECKVMGIPITRRDTARDLLNKLKAF